MKKYFENEIVTLWLGDCRDVEVPCDLIITDPPYGMEYKSNWSGNFEMLAMDDDIKGVQDCLLHACKQLKDNRHLYIFGNKFDHGGLPLGGITELIWDKMIMGMGDLTAPWGPQHEKITFAVYLSRKSHREKNRGALSARVRQGSVLRYQKPHGGAVTRHPTEKPVDLLRQLIESSSVMGECVYDPFCGSGSTLIASILEGRKSVGVEIEEKYCEVAAKRIEAVIGLEMTRSTQDL